MFQILGSNWSECGYANLNAMIDAMFNSADDHLEAFTHFLLKNKLDGLLREKKWAIFASRYNGPSYKVNRYDEKLSKTYLQLRNQK